MINKVFPILAISTFSSMLGVGIIAPLLPIYADTLGATGIWIGVIFSGFSISRALVMPLIGKLSDQKGERKAFLCAGLLFYAVMSLGYVWAETVTALVTVRLVHGLAAGMVIPIAQTYVGDLAPQGEEGKWMGYFNAALFAGFGVGPLLGGVLTDSYSMTTAFYSMGALNLFAFIVALVWLPKTRHVKSKNTFAHTSFRQMLRKSSMMKGIFSFRLANAFVRGSFSCFLPLFAGLYLGLSPTQIGTALCFNALIMSFLQIFSGRLADIFDRRKLVAIGSLVEIVILCLTPFLQYFYQLLILCAISGMGKAISIPAASGLTVGEGRKYGMGSVIGVFTLGMSLGMAVGPIASGVIMDHIGINWVFFIAAGFALLGTGMFLFFTRQKQPGDFNQ